jgi:hypothetical protein
VGSRGSSSARERAPDASELVLGVDRVECQKRGG